MVSHSEQNCISPTQCNLCPSEKCPGEKEKTFTTNCLVLSSFHFGQLVLIVPHYDRKYCFCSIPPFLFWDWHDKAACHDETKYSIVDGSLMLFLSLNWSHIFYTASSVQHVQCESTLSRDNQSILNKAVQNNSHMESVQSWHCVLSLYPTGHLMHLTNSTYANDKGSK